MSSKQKDTTFFKTKDILELEKLKLYQFFALLILQMFLFFQKSLVIFIQEFLLSIKTIKSN